MFDIKDFYLSIPEELLNKGLRFAEEYIDIFGHAREIIYAARKSLLFNKKDTWMKKQSGLFAVTKRAYDSANVCELAGTYMLFLISGKSNKKDVGLNRDDGLGVVKNKSGLETEKVKKNIQKIFKESKLDIVI